MSVNINLHPTTHEAMQNGIRSNFLNAQVVYLMEGNIEIIKCLSNFIKLGFNKDASNKVNFLHK